MSEAAVWLVLLLSLVAANSVVLWRIGSGRYRPPSFLLATASVLALIAASTLFVVAALWAHQHYPTPWHWPVLAATVGCTLIGLILLMGVLGFTFAQTIRAAFASGLTTACTLGFALIPLMVIYRAYQIPTNSMAPALCGWHYEGHCPECRRPTVVPLQEDSVTGTRHASDTGICRRCLQVRSTQGVGEQANSGDRIIVGRLRPPRRWDVVVFLSPGDRTSLYAMRLVGLPGESVEIKEGGVWINGVRQVPPPEIAGLRWFVDDETNMTAEFATAGNPMQLAKGKYFVLGDYSPHSYDSRFWGPLPAEDLRGVVSAVYWPPRSARILPRH